MNGVLRAAPPSCVHSAHAKPALDDVRWQAELLLPVGHQRDAAQMTTRRMPADIEPVRVTAETCGILVSPDDPATYLLRHHAQVAVCGLNRNDVERNEVRTGIDEHFGSVCVVLGLSAEPCAAMDEHKNRGIGA